MYLVSRCSITATPDCDTPLYLLNSPDHLRTARQKIRSQKREIPEGSEEWDLLLKRYYSEELKKLGIDLSR